MEIAGLPSCADEGEIQPLGTSGWEGAVHPLSPHTIVAMVQSRPAFVAPLPARRLIFMRPAVSPLCGAQARPVANRTARVRMSLLPLVPNWMLVAAWAYGAYRFYRGFHRTSYQDSFRVPLALAWPLLFVFNGSYRSNFTKSLKGSDDS